ncbi:MAG: Hpt domain-containing protein, partial [Gammaproteobacteria bacterium]|nr:Hpt domain-containing protein [Gammaproteobacteria bacterium]
NAMARKAMMLSQPGTQLVDPPGEAVADTVSVEQQVSMEMLSSQTALSGLPVLAEDADPEILEIFLEEAAEVIAIISENMPQWISQPDNSEPLATLCRSMHTLKGSGRMARALVMGEFAWALENLLNRVLDGAVEASDPLFVLLGRVPAALQQLFEQLRDGAAPELDIEEMVAHAEAFARGEIVEPAAADDAVPVESSGDGQVSPEENQVTEDTPEDDPGLLEIFTKECSEHLLLIGDFLESNRAPCEVTESLYRSLHTISGISNSANICSIMNLAGVLDDYFDGLYQGRHLASAAALDVLRDSATEISRLIQQLPDMSFDEEFQQQLRTRVEALPRTGEAQPADDPYAAVDSELLEVFIEEASEIIDAGENTLRAWADEPASQELMDEFQRQLHTLKGGARMVDITPMGDLSHTLESLLVRVVEGQVEVTPDLFVLLHDSHDHLAEMLEHVKA